MRLENMLLTFAVSAIFGIIFLKIKVPGGMLVGAIVGAAILNLGFDVSYMPSAAKLAAQITAGAFIGAMISKEDLKRLKDIYKIAGVVMLSFCIINLVVGFGIYWLVPYDLLTMLMCTIPGGLSDVPLIAADMGADIVPVLVIHFVRAVVGIGLFPAAIARLTCNDPSSSGVQTEKNTETKKDDIRYIVLTIILSVAFGLFGKWVGIPVGALVFSMLGIALVKILGFPAVIPKWLKRIAQVLSGAYIGCVIHREAFADLHLIILPTIIILIVYIVNAWFTGGILHKKLGVPRREAMLMLVPAGAGDMALISSDLGVNSPILILVQVLRLFVADAIMPQICRAITLLTGL